MNKPVFKNLNVPVEGEPITFQGETIVVGDKPIIPFIVGDGIGNDIWVATKLVLDSAVQKAYQGRKKIVWLELLAGEKAYKSLGEYLPVDTINAIEYFKVAIKGPLTTPVSGGFKSLNVALRQILDLYACIRPVRYFKGAPSPVKEPENMDIIIFRENTEDVYSGIEFEMGTENCEKLRQFFYKEMDINIRSDAGIGIKPISKFACRRIVRKAILFALKNNKKSVTMVHKGNIMKYTEGAFRNWGYELAKEEFLDSIITEEDLWNKYEGKISEGKIILKDRIADAMFMNILKRTKEYDVIVTTNLNGDYLSDACAAQVGGLGLAPGANISDSIALFEATHGTAPKYAGLDKVNPSSLLLSGAMLLQYIGWDEAERLIITALEKTIMSKKVTYDMEMENATVVKCSEFAQIIVSNL